MVWLGLTARPAHVGIQVDPTITTDRQDGQIATVARAHGIPPGLLEAMVQVESEGNPRARGRHGEIGLLQVKPSTAKLTARQLYDPMTNLHAGAAHLAHIHRRFVKLGLERRGEYVLSLIAYNAGERKVLHPRGKTVSLLYVTKVMKEAN